jgi:hypothetical protein
VIDRLNSLTVWYYLKVHTRPRLAHALLWTLEYLFRGNVIIHRAHKAIQGDDCRPRRRSCLKLLAVVGL